MTDERPLDDYEALEQTWTPLLHKIARWGVPGLEIDDVLQELRLTLLSTQQRYDSTKGATFMTYLYRACKNKVLKLRKEANAKGRVPVHQQVRLMAAAPGADFQEGGCPDRGCRDSHYQVADPGQSSGDETDLLVGLSPATRRLAELIIQNETKRADWIYYGLSTIQINAGLAELRVALR